MRRFLRAGNLQSDTALNKHKSPHKRKIEDLAFGAIICAATFLGLTLFTGYAQWRAPPVVVAAVVAAVPPISAPAEATEPPEMIVAMPVTVAAVIVPIPKPKNPISAVPAEGRVQIAIVIDDLGQDFAALDRVMELDPDLTLAFLPYGPGLQDKVDTAKGRGHEILLHLPMEPNGSSDPGPLALKTSLDTSEFHKVMDQNLTRFTGYVGVNNHMGSLLTADYSRMRDVMEYMTDRGLFFLDSRTSKFSSAEQAARDAGIPTIARDVFLDNSRSIENILQALADLEDIARKRGSAVAIGHPYPETIEALHTWIAGAEARGVDLVPLSVLLEPAE